MTKRVGDFGRVLLIGMAFFLVPCVFAAEIPDPERQYIEALRDRKLYALLEQYCRERLANASISAGEQALLTIELAASLDAQAREAGTAAAQTELRRRAVTLLEQFLKDTPNHPDALLVRHQLALTHLWWGESQRQRGELNAGDTSLVAEAREHLRLAADIFREMDRAAGQPPATGTERAASAYPARRRQLAELQLEARFQLGQALLGLGRSLPAQSADRLHAIDQAIKQFEGFTGRVSQHALVLEAYLATAECLRLKNDYAGAVKTLSQMERADTPPLYLQKATAARARILLDQGRGRAAKELLEENRKLPKPPLAELDYLLFRAYLGMATDARKTKQEDTAKELESKALALLPELEKRHGAYWARRGELLFADYSGGELLATDLSVVVRAAESFARNGQQTAAEQAYRRAAQLADEKGEKRQAVEYRFQAASALLEAGHFDEAGARFEKLIESAPAHPRTAEAHLMITYAVGRQYRREKTPELLTRYRNVLEDHLRQYGQDETAGEAHWLLGRLHHSQRRWAEAADHYRSVPASHPRIGEARRAAVDVYEAWLDGRGAASAETAGARRPPESSKDVEQFAAKAMAHLNALRGAAARSPAGRGPTDGSSPGSRDLRAKAAVVLARFELLPPATRGAEAVELLRPLVSGSAAVSGSPEGAAGSPLAAEARRWLIVGLALDGDASEAEDLLTAKPPMSAAELLALETALEQSGLAAAGHQRKNLARLHSRVAERLAARTAELPPDARVKAELAAAQAYVEAGDASQAIERFARARRLAPRSAEVVQAQAGGLTKLGQSQAALEIWRELAEGSPVASPLWYQAKYELARCYYQLGNYEQCRKIIAVTSLLHPDLGGPETKAKFEQLRVQVEGK